VDAGGLVLHAEERVAHVLIVGELAQVEGEHVHEIQLAVENADVVAGLEVVEAGKGCHGGAEQERLVAVLFTRQLLQLVT